jgi:NTE family protein
LALENEWGVRSRLADLPAQPEWSINGTTAESGKRFRFKSADIGDYSLGYASSEGFLLADALAVSAAFPGGFGPLTLKTSKYIWRKRAWGEPAGAEKQVEIGFKRLRLYDGGVYDNLGLEPFFDAGRGISKHPDQFIIVSDAGAPLQSGLKLGPLNPFRLIRVADIMSDQAHALRVRTFANYLQTGLNRGAFIHIASPESMQKHSEMSAFCTDFPTTLRRLNTDEFDCLAAYGYQVTLDVENL